MQTATACTSPKNVNCKLPKTMSKAELVAIATSAALLDLSLI